jgi:hypothetical protein
MTETAQIKSHIAAICKKRQTNLSMIEAELKEITAKVDPIARVLESIEAFQKYEQNEALAGFATELEAASKGLNKHTVALKNLRDRFARSTINIGVSGNMGVGKSTTLQKISGLADEQIPTGTGLAVTAVRSKVFNSDRNEAEVTFRSESSFVEHFVNPHLVVLGKPAISTLSQFSSLKLPEQIDKPTSVESDSLNRLKDAQEAIDSFKLNLTGNTETIPLSQIEQYVSYPKDTKSVERKYLAVDDMQIYCKFPALPDIKLGLIDLPGLGEIADNVAQMHTIGLENDVDHILMIIQPSRARGQYDNAMGKNIDQLCAVQAGVRKRGNLITAAINHRDDAEDLEATLRDDFIKNVNTTRLDDEIELLSFSAVDEIKVEELFNHLLHKLTDTLAAMDVEILEYTKNQKGSVGNVTAIMQNIYYCVQGILSEIPLEEEQKFELLNEIAKNLRYEYAEFESEMKRFATQESDWSKEYKALVNTIHSDCEHEINNGLFEGSKQAWVKLVKGSSGDYINCYRQEAERVRRELISSYDRLNEYYTSHLDKFKSIIINIFLKETYNFKDLVVIEDLSVNEIISRLITELSGSVRDNDFIDAFRLLLNMSFQFRQNVFYNLAPCLERLSNAPDEIYNPNQKAHQNESPVFDMRPLGEIGVPFASVEPLMEDGLKYLANEANNAIKDALLNYDDKFNQYVFICAQFFNDYLYRKDEDKFKNVNIRCFVDSYKNYIVDAGKQHIDGEKERLLTLILDSIKCMNLHMDFGMQDVSLTSSGAFILGDRIKHNKIYLPNGRETQGETTKPTHSTSSDVLIDNKAQKSRNEQKATLKPKSAPPTKKLDKPFMSGVSFE